MGRIRGKRNRDGDRYWHERRKATQGGMVGADDASACCFCGHLVSSDDALLSASTDTVFCRTCGESRGFIRAEHEIPRHDGGTVELLMALDAIGAWESVSGNGPGSRANGTVVGFQISGHDKTIVKQPPEARARAARMRVLARAMLWLSRDVTVPTTDVEGEAMEVLSMPLDAARAAVHQARQVVYRQQHPTTQEENLSRIRKLTDAQVLEMRERYAAGGCTFKSLAKDYGVSYTTVSFVVSGSVYKHVGGPIHNPRHTPRYEWFYA